MFEVVFTPWEMVAIFLIFLWGGVVRSGIGFGGAALSLPLLLLIYPDPLFFLPIIGIHLLVFAMVNLYGRLAEIDWHYLSHLLKILIIPKLLGVLGVLQLPNDVLLIIIYGISLFFGCSYILDNVLAKKGNRTSEFILICIGGYVSGTALSGAPAIVPMVARYVRKNRVRSTLFMLWIILVVFKLSAFAATGQSFYLEQQLWLFPAAAIGNWFGLKLHQKLQQFPEKYYYRTLGGVLLTLGALGLTEVNWQQLPSEIAQFLGF